jgi:hypothetical protein
MTARLDTPPAVRSAGVHVREPAGGPCVSYSSSGWGETPLAIGRTEDGETCGDGCIGQGGTSPGRTHHAEYD